MFFSSCGFSLGLSNVSILGITTQRPLSEVSTQSDQWGTGGGVGGERRGPRASLWVPVNSEGMRSPVFPKGAWVDGEAAEGCSRKIRT